MSNFSPLVTLKIFLLWFTTIVHRDFPFVFRESEKVKKTWCCDSLLHVPDFHCTVVLKKKKERKKERKEKKR